MQVLAGAAGEAGVAPLGSALWDSPVATRETEAPIQPSLLQPSLALVLMCLMVVGMKIYAINWGFEFSLLIFTSPCQTIHFLDAGRLGPALCLFLGNLFPKRGDKLQLFSYLSCVLPGKGEVMAPLTARGTWFLAPWDLHLTWAVLLAACFFLLCGHSKRGEDSNSVLIVIMALAMTLMPSRRR